MQQFPPRGVELAPHLYADTSDDGTITLTQYPNPETPEASPTVIRGIPVEALSALVAWAHAIGLTF